MSQSHRVHLAGMLLALVTLTVCKSEAPIEPGTPTCTVVPSTLTFGVVPIDSVVAREFVVSNVGSGALTGAISISGAPDFRVDSGGGGFNLSSGETRRVRIVLQPQATGAKACVVSLGTTSCPTIAGTGTVEALPVCDVSPAELAFGDVLVGTSREMSFTIRNAGGGVLRGVPQALCPQFSVVAGGTPFALTAGTSRTVTVHYEPTAELPGSCTVTLGAAACDTVQARGTGRLTAICALEPTTLAFGTLVVGTSAEQIFILRNVGNAPLTGIIAASCSQFAIAEGGGQFTLGPNESRAVRVSYAPTVEGHHECNISLGTSLCPEIACAGDATRPPCCTVSPSTHTVDFGLVPERASLDRSVTVTNCGPTQFCGTPQLSGTTDYSLLTAVGPFCLEPGQSTTFTIRFAPMSAGQKTCTLTFGASPCDPVALTGVGDPPPFCEVAPTTLQFGTVVIGETAEQTFTVRNTGGQTLSGNIPLTCGASGNFRVSSGAGPLNLRGGESKEVAVQFIPQAPPGPKSCILSLGVPGLCAFVECYGEADPPVACEISPSSLSFGLVPVGTSRDQEVTITNIGGGRLVGTVAPGCADFTVPTTGGDYSLGRGEVRRVIVRFTPEMGGAQTCRLDLGNPLCADLSCTGVGDPPPVCTVDSVALHFGTLRSGTIERSFYITNTGGQTLTGTLSLGCTTDFRISAFIPRDFMLRANERKFVEVYFATTTPGPKTCTLYLGTALCPAVECTGFRE